MEIAPPSAHPVHPVLAPWDQDKDAVQKLMSAMLTEFLQNVRASPSDRITYATKWANLWLDWSKSAPEGEGPRWVGEVSSFACAFGCPEISIALEDNHNIAPSPITPYLLGRTHFFEHVFDFEKEATRTKVLSIVEAAQELFQNTSSLGFYRGYTSRALAGNQHRQRTGFDASLAHTASLARPSWPMLPQDPSEHAAIVECVITQPFVWGTPIDPPAVLLRCLESLDKMGLHFSACPSRLLDASLARDPYSAIQENGIQIFAPPRRLPAKTLLENQKHVHEPKIALLDFWLQRGVTPDVPSSLYGQAAFDVFAGPQKHFFHGASKATSLWMWDQLHARGISCTTPKPSLSRDPVFWVAKKGLSPLMSTLITYGARCDAPLQPNQPSIWHGAAHNTNQIEAKKMLDLFSDQQLKACLHQTLSNGAGPVAIAVAYINAPVLQKALDLGAKPDVSLKPEKKQRTSTSNAWDLVGKSSPRFAKKFTNTFEALAAQTDLSPYATSILQAALKMNALDATSRALDMKADPNVLVFDQPAISFAIQQCQGLSDDQKPIGVALIEKFIALGADIHGRDHDQNTPLHAACLHGNFLAAQILLSHGADPHAQNERGHWPSHFAAKGFMRKSFLKNLETQGQNHDLIKLIDLFETRVDLRETNPQTSKEHFAGLLDNPLFAPTITAIRDHAALSQHLAETLVHAPSQKSKM